MPRSRLLLRWRAHHQLIRRNQLGAVLVALWRVQEHRGSLIVCGSSKQACTQAGAGHWHRCSRAANGQRRPAARSARRSMRHQMRQPLLTPLPLTDANCCGCDDGDGCARKLADELKLLPLPGIGGGHVSGLVCVWQLLWLWLLGACRRCNAASLPLRCWQVQGMSMRQLGKFKQAPFGLPFIDCHRRQCRRPPPSHPSPAANLGLAALLRWP